MDIISDNLQESIRSNNQRAARDGNGSGRARIMPTRNPTRQKKIRPLPARLPAEYSLKNYPWIFLKPAGTRGYPILANI